MGVIDDFKASNCWDHQYDLPLIPGKDNPWFYSAMAKKIIDPTGEWRLDAFELHAAACEIQPGLYARWPDGSGSPTSHDELLGMGSHSADLAGSILNYLSNHFGKYNTKDPGDTGWKHWMYLRAWVIAFLKSRVNKSPGLWQLGYIATLVVDMLSYSTPDADGRLRIWLTLDQMEKHTLCHWFVGKWRRVMNGKGLSPKVCLAESLADVPVMAKYAPEKF